LRKKENKSGFFDAFFEQVLAFDEQHSVKGYEKAPNCLTSYIQRAQQARPLAGSFSDDASKWKG
jgi:hypothetical protein